MRMLVAPESPSDDVTRMPAVQSRKRPSQRTIDDVAGAGRIAISRRLLLETR